jgi:hypothetical protein
MFIFATEQDLWTTRVSILNFIFTILVYVVR